MFSPDGNVALGWVMHLMMGIIFGIVYAALWAVGIGSATVISGAIFGVVHWLIVGVMMGAIPMLHAGIKAGSVSAPGVFMRHYR